MTAHRRLAAGAAVATSVAGLLCAAIGVGAGAAVAAPATYALPACYGQGSPPVERPRQAQFQTCADGSKELTDLVWTAWGPAGAEGTGTYSYQVCEPNCAAGHRVSFPAVVHADGPLAGSGCPADTQLYANLVIAFPQGVPDAAGGPTNIRFRGMPATVYSTEGAPDSPTSLGDPVC
ncbi:hypothetical protein MMAD_37430 [Mycolicibacterium madagascariense]|uniref:Uncharacterized protein n=1 Tax=Mycolicibacterium madagascariense TaxID=212765 RepID=A0A7I7XJS7_9MYCO|nr:hypothetical protein [Mycolicibacterium madagascariense]MCV7012978.1 hypothetical protein [Mycolicibacterium madagascariense]BBZ29448.1 hypothetical protein MMAD_37430 [Mycolicibacterium madagascariense]